MPAGVSEEPYTPTSTGVMVRAAIEGPAGYQPRPAQNRSACRR